LKNLASEIGLKAVALIRGRSPTCAVAAIFMASFSSGKELTIKEISDIAGMTEVCVLECFML
jgi:transcription initiation factor TFIIIB Brf1 subunit/transcription initiation factor TFIIB